MTCKYSVYFIVYVILYIVIVLRYSDIAFVYLFYLCIMYVMLCSTYFSCTSILLMLCYVMCEITGLTPPKGGLVENAWRIKSTNVHKVINK